MSNVEHLAEGVTLHLGDCLEVLDSLPENSIDAVVTDPPYHLTAGKKGGTGLASVNPNSPAGRSMIGTGFMGKAWDGGDIAFRPETWAKVMRVLKPGAHLVAFGAPKNYHRLACAIEDAGFEIRDCIFWCFGQGFPKSKNLDGDWEGWGTSLKPAYEPIVLARKPLSEGTVAANVLRWGTGAINIDATRVEISEADRDELNSKASKNPTGKTAENVPFVQGIASKPNALGRWPANLCHDGSQQVLDLFPETAPSKAGVRNNSNKGHEGWSSGTFRSGPLYSGHSDSGSAARFFYSPKASKHDRAGSRHPTVKPVNLMRWLVRMVTPPGGTVLDPFAGSGTTGVAAVNEGFNIIMIEKEEEYQKDIRNRFDDGQK